MTETTKRQDNKKMQDAESTTKRQRVSAEYDFWKFCSVAKLKNLCGNPKKSSFEMNIYYMINWFFLCSLLGYLLECVVLSCENRTPVLNRGFGHGPFCIIYGFGAMGANLFLGPISDRPLLLYMSSMSMATCMELVTAGVMIRLFGSFWWDYSKKKCNYKGIICLESSLGWGLLGIVYFRFLNGFLMRLAGFVPHRFEKRLAVALVLFYLTDFLWCLRHQIKNRGEEQEQVIGRLSVRP